MIKLTPKPYPNFNAHNLHPNNSYYHCDFKSFFVITSENIAKLSKKNKLKSQKYWTFTHLD